MAWLAGWTYRKSITLSRASGAVTDYQMKLLVGESSGATGESVDCGGHVATDFDDLRFTTSDGTTLLSYWIESLTGTTPNQLATVWIKFNSIGTGATTFYMYYGNSGASAVSSGASTFIVFDDADAMTGTPYDNGWTDNAGDGTLAYSTDDAKYGSKSIKVAQTGANAFYASRTFDALADFRLTFWLKQSDSTQNLRISGYNAAAFVHAYGFVSGSEGADLQYYTTAYQDTGYNVSTSWTEYEYRGTAGDDKIAWLQNGTQIAADSHSNAWTSETVFRIMGTASKSETYYVDALRIAKYVATEPAWGSWSAEGEAIVAACAISAGLSAAAKSTQVVPGAAAVTAAASLAENADAIMSALGQVSAAAAVEPGGSLVASGAVDIDAASSLALNADTIARAVAAIEAVAEMSADGKGTLSAAVAAIVAAELALDGDAALSGKVAAIVSAVLEIVGSETVIWEALCAVGITASATADGNTIASGVADIDIAASVAALQTRMRPGAAAVDIAASLAVLQSLILRGVMAASVAASVTTDADATKGGVAGIEAGASLGLDADAVMRGVAGIIAAAAVAPNGDGIFSGQLSANVVAALEIIAGEVNLIRAVCELGITAEATVDGDLVARGVSAIEVAASLAALQQAIRSGTLAATVAASLATNGDAVMSGAAGIEAGASVGLDADAVLLGALAAGISAAVSPNADRVAGGVSSIDVVASLAAAGLRIRPGASAVEIVAALAVLSDEVNLVLGECALGISSSLGVNGDLVASGVVSAQAVASAALIAQAIRDGRLSATVVADLILLATQVVPGAAQVLMSVAVSNTCWGNVIANGAVTITASNALTLAATAYIAQVCGYTGTLLPGDVLEIDCDKMTVKLNGADSRRYWTGRFPKLYVGTNEVRYADDEAARTVALDEEHDPRWL